MNKILLTSAGILFMGLAAFAQDAKHPVGKTAALPAQKECRKDLADTKKDSKSQWAIGANCNKDQAACTKKCNDGTAQKSGKSVAVK